MWVLPMISNVRVEFEKYEHGRKIRAKYYLIDIFIDMLGHLKYSHWASCSQWLQSVPFGIVSSQSRAQSGTE